MLYPKRLTRAVGALIDNPTSRAAAQEVFELAVDADEEAADEVEELVEVPAPSARRGCRVRQNLIQGRCPRRVERPRMASDVAERVASLNFKGVGGGWGYSAAAHTAGASVILGEHFRGVESIPPSELRAGIDPTALCRFDAGTTIAELDCELRRRGRALVNAPGFDALTFVGVASVGGNGSGIWLGPLAEQIRSIDFLHVDEEGQWQRLRVEPRSPDRAITRDDFPGPILRDDALFDTCKVGLGLVGLIVSVTIDVVPSFHLTERRTRCDWRTLLAELPHYFEAQGGRHSGKPLHSVEVWMNPYHDKKSCIVGTRSWTPLGTRLGRRPYAVRKSTASTFRLVSAVMRRSPQSVPQLLAAGLKLTRSGDVRLPSSEALSFGALNTAEVDPAAVALDASDLPRLIACLTELRAWFRQQFDAGRYVSSPIGLRFVGQASSPLSPHWNRRSCLVEVPLLRGTRDADAFLAAFLDKAATLGGRPHWGQIHHLDAAGLRHLYGSEAVRAFGDARARLDPLGRCDNALASRLEVGKKPEAVEPGVEIDAANRRSWGRLLPDRPPAESITLPEKMDVLRALSTLRKDGKRLVLHGGSCSMHTQNLSDGERLYFDSPRWLSRKLGELVSGERTFIELGAAARWGDVVAHTLARGYVPPVVPTCSDITVGGSLSANSIGQASRHAGHELDHVVKLDVIVPGRADEEPRRVSIDAVTPGPDEHLLRSIVGGYGLIGVIESATYELTKVASEAKALTTCRRFDHADIGSALKALMPAGPDDRFHKSCVFFHRKGRWSPTVLSTHFGDAGGKKTRSLLTYSGNSPARQVAERMLSFMPSAHLAGKLADQSMREASRKSHLFENEIRDFLFVMDPNAAHKKSLSPSGAAIFAPTLQQTFVVPAERAEAFLRYVQARLAETRLAPGKLAAAESVTRDDIEAVFDDDALVDGARIELDLMKLERKDHAAPQKASRSEAAQRASAPQKASRSEAAQRDSAPPALETLTRPKLIELVLALMQRGARLPTLVPALFELVWVPDDHQYLSATFGKAGFAISLTFQGPGVDGDAPIVRRIRIFERLHRAIYSALRDIAQHCADLGGRFNLSKNVFTPAEGPAAPGCHRASALQKASRSEAARRASEPQKEEPHHFVRAVLSQRANSLDRFEEAYRAYNGGGFFGSLFGAELLGLK